MDDLFPPRHHPRRRSLTTPRWQRVVLDAVAEPVSKLVMTGDLVAQGQPHHSGTWFIAWWDKAHRPRRTPILVLAITVTLGVVLIPLASRGNDAFWFAVSSSSLKSPLTATMPAGVPAILGDLRTRAFGAQACICALLPWACDVERLQLMPYSQTPGPHHYADWPADLTSHPFPYPWRVLYPAIAATYPEGDAEQAKRLGESVWDCGHYNPNGRYYPGYSLVRRINDFGLTRYDDPWSTC
jgi:hypothetical protein